MMDLCISGVQVMVEKFKRFMASSTGVFLYASVTGIAGIIILLAFLSMVFSPSILTMILPGIIAFNCAAGGYSLIEKQEGDAVSHRLALAAMAMLLTIAGCSVIVLFCPWEPLFDAIRYLVCGLMAVIFTVVGAWIGVKSKSLNKVS
ncbi:MAG: hypothetical protein ACWGOX_05405 [Desulforhopalus sp.]